MTKVPERIVVAQPPMGGKAYVTERPGLFVLEVGPGTLITDACTHAGGGGLVLYDGIPDENGYFPVDGEAPLPFQGEEGSPDHAVWLRASEAYGKRHGRELLRQPSAVMGSWMLNAGFHNGLTLDVSGAHSDMYPVATIVWQPFRVRV